jgi:hypothetical protein
MEGLSCTRGTVFCLATVDARACLRSCCLPNRPWARLTSSKSFFASTLPAPSLAVQPGSRSRASRCRLIRMSFILIQVLPQFRCSGEPRDIGSNRARRSSKPARPYIWRLSLQPIDVNPPPDRCSNFLGARSSPRSDRDLASAQNASSHKFRNRRPSSSSAPAFEPSRLAECRESSSPRCASARNPGKLF